MRALSDSYTNGYIITIFACCRELYDHTTMCNGVTKKQAKRGILWKSSSLAANKVQEQDLIDGDDEFFIERPNMFKAPSEPP